MDTHRAGLLIRGLSWNSSADPTLFTDGPLSAASIPAGHGPLSDANLQIVSRIPPRGVSGANVTGDIQDPLGNVSTPTVLLEEDEDNSFAQIFGQDLGGENTSTWVVEPVAARIDDSDTTFRLAGESSPTDGQILWIGQEAVKVSGTPSLIPGGSQSWSVTVVRGVCGSRARVHAVDPAAYVDGDDGSKECLTVTSRPAWESFAFEASLYHFRLKDEDPHAVSSVEFVWHGFVGIEEIETGEFVIGARPKEDGKGHWKVPIPHVLKRIANHTFELQKGMELTHCFRVVERGLLINVNPGIGVPGFPGQGGSDLSSFFGHHVAVKASVRLTRYEVERFFRNALRPTGSQHVDVTATQNLETALLASDDFPWEVVAEVGGHTWVYRITGVTRLFFFPESGVRLDLTLRAKSRKASIQDNPVEYPGGDGHDSRIDGLNAGWIENGTGSSTSGDEVRFDQGETPPKITLRPRLLTSFPKALAAILLSGHGEKDNDATHDVLVGRLGLGLDPTWVDLGSEPASPSAVDEDTTELLPLSSLLGETYEYALTPGLKLKDWLTNELRLHTCLLGFDPTTGKIGARLWARAAPASPTSLNQARGLSRDIVPPARRLGVLRALRLQRGIDPITLEHTREAGIRIPNVPAREARDAPIVRIWKPIDAAIDPGGDITTSTLARLSVGMTTMLQGAPPVWPVPVPFVTSLKYGDSVSYTDPDIATAGATGRGLTARRCLVIGLDRRFEDGRTTAQLLADAVNDLSASEGKIAPALRITRAKVRDADNEVDLIVESVGESSFNIETAHGAIWSDLAASGGRVRVVTPQGHNPELTKERPGFREFSGTVVSISHESATGQNFLTLAHASAWETNTRTIANTCVEGASFVLLSDRRPVDSSTEFTVIIEPDPEQLHNGGDGDDFLWIAPGSGSPSNPPFNGHFSKIADT